MSYATEPPLDAGPAVLPPGTVVAGKYVVERVLGKGGMGYVVAAQHVQLREPVALKFLHAEMAKKPALMARFEREARAAARIKSEHVARVIDVGNHEGAPFIVMEMLSGSDFHKLSAVRGPLPWTEAALYLAQACEVVAEAHLYGIVHRDLKPANLFLTHRADGSPLVKVLDFGISKVTGEADENLTQTTDVLGSPLYMSPEQIESPRDVDARTDVWALGAILYKMIVGKAAFAADTASASLAKIVTRPPPALRPQRPDLPPELEALVLRCLEKDVTRRMQTAGDLGRALAPFAGIPRPRPPRRAPRTRSPAARGPGGRRCCLPWRWARSPSRCWRWRSWPRGAALHRGRRRSPGPACRARGAGGHRRRLLQIVETAAPVATAAPSATASASASASAAPAKPVRGKATLVPSPGRCVLGSSLASSARWRWSPPPGRRGGSPRRRSGPWPRASSATRRSSWRGARRRRRARSSRPASASIRRAAR